MFGTIFLGLLVLVIPFFLIKKVLWKKYKVRARNKGFSNIEKDNPGGRP